MTPDGFINKWKNVTVGERAAAQSHFIDLCRLLDEPAPTDVDPDGKWYAFEKGATKTTGGEGWADVWKKGCFAWEYKGKRKDLNSAFVQLQQYALALENPPLLVVSDIERFRIATNWTNTVSKTFEYHLDDLKKPEVRDALKAVLSQPDKLRPGKTRQALTEEAAGEFARLAQRLRDAGHAPDVVAHFVNRLVFCMFAEDVDLLPGKMFRRMLESSLNAPDKFHLHARALFGAMRGGGMIGFEHVDWFNGGLFDDDTALPLTKDDVALALKVADLDWAEIDPSIFGTLFERGLDPDKRSQLGAHYTDRDKIKLIVDAVVVHPLTLEWEETKSKLVTSLQKIVDAKTQSAKNKAEGEAVRHFREFLDRLRAFHILDPACGSGNFLYLALLALKDLEHKVSLEAEAISPRIFPREFPHIGPGSVKGIEINPYAAELARVSIWIGEIQWMQRNGFSVSKNPILKPLKTIECRDALINPDGSEATWPSTNVIVGNPPFLGDKAMIGTLGEQYVSQLRSLFAGRLPGGVDLVAYWFEKARAILAAGSLQRAGFVATQAIRRGQNRTVLDGIVAQSAIYYAWADEPWVVEGASVRVSIVCFGTVHPATKCHLDGEVVPNVRADLTAVSPDLTHVAQLRENRGVCFQGPVKVGPFDVAGNVARQWLTSPLNPNGKSNADVVRPLANGQDLVGRTSDRWLIDFGERTVNEAALYEGPFEHVRAVVKPLRDANRDTQRRERWWRLGRSGADLRAASSAVTRVIATPRVAKHRVFVWIGSAVIPDSRVCVITRDDDTTFGVLHSRYHEAWSLRLGGWHGVGNDPQYTPSSGFETFPFPEGLTPKHPAWSYEHDPRAVRIAAAAIRLNQLRENWLNPPDLVKRVPEVVVGFPDRLLPVDDSAAAILRKRTLTNLYNQRPTWLATAHAELDAAVAAAYGWPENIGEDEALERLLTLNAQRA
jgi:type II restriction/modification system DNA methylase subunit YeeA